MNGRSLLSVGALFSSPVTASALLASTLFASAATAQTIHYSSGFETPVYVAGPLAGSTIFNGQDGWVATGDLGTNPDFSRIVVQTAIDNGGAQAVEIDATSQPSPYAHIRRHTFVNVAPSEPILDIVFDMRIASAATTASEWGIQAQSAPGPGSGILEWWIDVFGELHITGASGFVATGYFFPRDDWKHVVTRVDYAAQTTSVFVDGQLLATVPALSGATHWAHAFTSLMFIQPGDDRMYVDNFVILTHDGQTVSSYCTAGVSTSGCQATLAASGSPSASASSGFTLSASNVEGGVNGSLFYGVSGRVAFPWSSTSTSTMCVKSPVRRMGLSAAGGAASSCSGAISSDFLAFMAGHPGALGQPIGAGQTFNVQLWYRDPPAPKSTNLSDALEFVLMP